MNRIECIAAFAAVRGDAVVVVGPGFAGHELAAEAQRDATLYNMEMGYATPMCHGLALALAPSGRKVVAIEGDGSVLVGLSSLATLARYPSPNLVVVVFDNGQYLTTGRGGVQTATSWGTDLAAIAAAVGLGERACSVDSLEDFSAALGRAMTSDGPWCIVAHVDLSDREDPRARQHFETDLADQAALFRRALRLGPGGAEKTTPPAPADRE